MRNFATLLLVSEYERTGRISFRQFWLRRFARVQADAEQVPFADGSVDLIVSNLMLPWCNPDSVFAEFRRVLPS